MINGTGPVSAVDLLTCSTDLFFEDLSLIAYSFLIFFTTQSVWINYSLPFIKLFYARVIDQA